MGWQHPEDPFLLRQTESKMNTNMVEEGTIQPVSEEKFQECKKRQLHPVISFPLCKGKVMKAGNGQRS